MRDTICLAICVFSICALSCSDDYSEVVRSETVSAFHSIEVNDVFNIQLVQADFFSVEIIADKDVVNNIDVAVTDSTLILVNRSHQKWLTPSDNKITVIISFPDLRNITARETCSIKSLNKLYLDHLSITAPDHAKLSEVNLDIDCYYFSYWNNYLCGGKLTVTGRAYTAYFGCYSLLSVDASALETEYAIIESYSKADSRIWVTTWLEYSIHSTGNIYLRGNPSEIFLSEKTSSGQLIHIQ